MKTPILVNGNRIDSPVDEKMSHTTERKRIGLGGCLNNTFGSQSYASTIFNFINGAVGTGILMLPSVMHECGVVVGILCLFFCGLMGAASQYYLASAFIYCKDIDSKCTTYEKVGRILYGWVFSKIVHVFLFLNCFVSTIIYVIFIGDVLKGWIPVDYNKNAKNGILLAVITPSIVLSLFKRVTSLRFISYLSFVTTNLFLLGIIVLYFLGYADGHRAGSTKIFPNGNGSGAWSNVLSVLSVSGICLGLYDDSALVCNIVDDYKRENAWRVGRAILVACVVVFLFDCTFSEFGYLIFVDNTKSNFIENFNGVQWFEIFLSVMLSFSILLTFPMGCYPSRVYLTDFFIEIYDVIRSKRENAKKETHVTADTKTKTPNNVSQQRPKKWEKFQPLLTNMVNALITILIGLSAYTFAVVYPYIAQVFNIFGGTISLCCCYVFPCCFHLTISYKQHFFNNNMYNRGGLFNKKKRLKQNRFVSILLWLVHPERVMVFLILIVSSVIGVSSTILTIVISIREL